MASLSITVPDAQVPRVQEMVGAVMGYRAANGTARSATTAEVQSYIAEQLKARVYAYEQDRDGNTARNAVSPITAA